MSFLTAFARLHTLAGNPTMECIEARSEWSSVVPAGYAYDADYDRYVNNSGTVWDETSVTLPSDDVDILADSGLVGFDLVAPGLADAGDRFVYIKAADQSTVAAAQYVVLDSQKYDVREITPFPAGNAQWYTVQLTRR